MTIPPLTAAELFDIVKEHDEVFRDTMYYSPSTRTWRGKGTNWAIRDDIATLTLLSLFTLAAECGIMESRVGPGVFMAFGVTPQEDLEVLGRGPHPLIAAKAAYEKKTGAKR